MNNFTAHTDSIREDMLSSIGCKSVEDLFSNIPNSVRMDSLNLGKPLSEMSVQKEIKELAAKNNTDKANFLGGGIYNKFIPACVGAITSRFEFNTAYTPYQPEISQGTLQSIYEFQSMICFLTGMDVSNASVYDGATAAAESLFMAARLSKRNKVLVAESINPEIKEVLKTYLHANSIDFDTISTVDYKVDCEYIKNNINQDEYAAILVQSPNYYGTIEDIESIFSCITDAKMLKIWHTDPASLTVLKSPKDFDADIVSGDIQTLGIPMSFGGPTAGFIACKDAYKRQLPGRIVGKTLDKDGKTAYTLTLQTREQHIRREKATSNICSNQALIALASTVYMTVMGEKGISQALKMSANNSRKLAEKLVNIGYKVLNSDFLYEFVLKVDDADDFLSKMSDKNINAGIKISQNEVLVTTTEMTQDNDILSYCEVASKLLTVDCK